MDLLATTKDGSAFAVNVTGDTTVNLEGNLLAKAVASGDGTAYSLMTDKGTLVVSGQNVALSGDVAVQNAGSLSFGSDAGSAVNLTGNVSVDQQSSIMLQKASVGERQKFCVHGIIGARQTGASNEHEHQTQFS